MRINFLWILFMIFPYLLVKSHPVKSEEILQPSAHNAGQIIPIAQLTPKENEDEDREKIISVRITSSVAVGRSSPKWRPQHSRSENTHFNNEQSVTTTRTTVDITSSLVTEHSYNTVTTPSSTINDTITLPPHLVGANIEYIKQLQAKKETRESIHSGQVYSSSSIEFSSNDTQILDSEGEATNQDILNVNINEKDEHNADIPLARSIPLSYSSKSFIQRGGHNSQKLTTVSFNIVHDSPKVSYNERGPSYLNPSSPAPHVPNYFNEPAKVYNEPAKVYSEPAQIYSEPAKFYSEPSKIYSEPSKIYSEPAKIYSEPSKIYSEPAKFYSEPASLHLKPETDHAVSNTWLPNTETTFSTAYSTTPLTEATYSSGPSRIEHQPEKNYEVDEKISVMTDGRSHGEQPTNPENCKQEKCKVGYVVEGRQFRKYRVEERTSDGFIVGEYGVVRNEDGALRGVRYTADSEASPRLIHDALMKFLQLK